MSVQTTSPLWALWDTRQQRLIFVFIGPAPAQYSKLSGPMKLQREEAIQAINTEWTENLDIAFGPKVSAHL